MKFFAEREAEEFLKQHSFDVIETYFIDDEKKLKGVVEKIGFPIVLKISGKDIVHKSRIGGVKTEIKNFAQVLKAFSELKKIRGFEGILIQRQIKGEEFLLGIKNTDEFGHVIVFGAGGIDVEKVQDVAFRVCPIEKEDVFEMIKEIKNSECLSKEDIEHLSEVLLKLCHLSKNFPAIKELDINPLILEKGKGKIVDARIVMN